MFSTSDPIPFADIDAATSGEVKKTMLRMAADALRVDQTSPRFHAAFRQVMEEGRPAAEALEDMVRFEDRAREMWVSHALQPWCNRHGLTLQQGLSVLFDDGAFNPKDPGKDLVTRDSVFGWSGQQNNFFPRLMADLTQAGTAASAVAQSPKDLVLQGVQRWDVMQGQEDALDDEPTYEIRVKAHPGGGQVIVDVIPPQFLAALSDVEFARCGDDDLRLKLPALSLGIEINDGLPCVHVHAGPLGELTHTVFAMGDGKVALREVDDPGMKDALVKVPDTFSPDLREARATFAAALGTNQRQPEGESEEQDRDAEPLSPRG